MNEKPSILSRLPPDAKLMPAKQWYEARLDRICREGRARAAVRMAQEEEEKRKAEEAKAKRKK